MDWGFFTLPFSGINDLGGLCLLLFSLLSFLLPLLFLGSLLLQKFLTNQLQVGDSLFPFHGHLQIFKLIFDKRNQIWTHLYSISHYHTGNSLISWLNFCGFCGYLLLTNKYPQWILKQNLYLLYIEANLLNNIPMILNDTQVYPSRVLKIKSTYSIYPCTHFYT